MKMLIKAIEDEGHIKQGKRILTFKEFCQYVYEPSKRIPSLNLSEHQKQEIEEVIRKRLRP